MNSREKQIKANLGLNINRSLLAVCFTIFVLIITLSPKLFSNFVLVTIQLTIAIPLLLSSILAKTKAVSTKKYELWDSYGFITFLLGYSFLINVVGIILSKTLGLKFGLTFLGANIAISILYFLVELLEDKTKLRSKLKKNIFFIALIVLGGILPSVGIY